MYFTNVRALKNVLPGLGLEFEFNEMTGRTEKKIFNTISSNPKLSGMLPWQVFCTLVIALKKIGSVTFDQSVEFDVNSEKFRDLHLSIGDVYYMYLYLRILQIDGVLKVRQTCGHCKDVGVYPIALEDLEVAAASNPAELTSHHDLDFSVKIADGEYSKIAVSAVEFNPDQAAIDTLVDGKSQVISKAIKFEGYDFPLTEELVESWPIRVRSKLFEEIDRVSVGISDNTILKCSKCERGISVTISWDYLSFFS